MTLTFIYYYLADDWAAIHREMAVMAVPYVAVFAAIAVDLIAGVTKARAIGEARTSVGLRLTVVKFKDYYSMLIIASVIDVLLSVLPAYGLPYATFIIGLYLVVIEWLSVREKASEKVRRRTAKDAQLLITLLESRDGLTKAAVEMLKKEVGNGATSISGNAGNVNTGTVGGDMVNKD
jgi:hypothetical protein